MRYYQKEVNQYTEYGRYLHTYESLSVAALYMGVSASSISHAIKTAPNARDFSGQRTALLSKKGVKSHVLFCILH